MKLHVEFLKPEVVILKWRQSLLVLPFFLFFTPLLLSAQHLQWLRKLESNTSLKVSDMKFGPNSSVYLLVNYSGSIDVDPGAAVLNLNSVGQTDFCLLHILASGTLNWYKNFGSGGADYGNAIELDASGNILIAGSFSSYFDFDPGPASIGTGSFGLGDAFVARYDVNGNYIEHRSFGGMYNDEILDIQKSANGNFVVSGSFSGTIDFDPGIGQSYLGTINGLSDVFVVSFDASLNFLWVKTFGGTGVTRVVKLETDPADNIYACGYFSGQADFDPSANQLFFPAGGISTFIFSLHPNGALRRLGFLNSVSQCFPLDMAVGNNGTLTLCGRFNGLTDMNPDTASQQQVLGSAQGDDAFMMMLDSSLNLLWHKTLISSFADAVSATAFLPDGHIIFSGYFKGIYDFLDGPDYAVAGSDIESKAFLLHLDSACGLLGVKDFGTDGTAPNKLAISSIGLILLSGKFSGTVNMSPDTGRFNITATNTDQIFLSRYWFCAPISMPGSINGDTLLCSGTSSIYGATQISNPVWMPPSGWSVTMADSTLIVHAASQSGWIHVASSAACGIGPAIALPVHVNMVDVSLQNTAGALWSPNYQATSYQWLDCNAGFQPIPGAQFQLFWPTSPGSYAVQIQQDACIDTSACENVIITSSTWKEFSNADFYPNPVGQFTQIQLSESVQKVMVYNLNGAPLIWPFQFSEGSLLLDFTNATAGFYTVEIFLRSGEVIRRALLH